MNVIIPIIVLLISTLCVVVRYRIVKKQRCTAMNCGSRREKGFLFCKYHMPAIKSKLDDDVDAFEKIRKEIISKARTIRECLEQELVASGMFPEQAKAVMDRVVADDPGKLMVDRWNDAYEGYPPTFISLLWNTSVRRHAREWLAENCPLAWYRPFFEDNSKNKD